MEKIEEVTCIIFQEKNKTFHKELVLSNVVNEVSFDNELTCFKISNVNYSLL